MEFAIRPEIGLLWAYALESGEYPQGVGLLRDVRADGISYWCCLGVLADLHRKIVGGTWGRKSDGCDCATCASYDAGRSYLGQCGLLPREVAAWAGIPNPADEDSVNVHFPEEDHTVAASTLNDSHRETFPQIAARIRALVEAQREA